MRIKKLGAACAALVLLSAAAVGCGSSGSGSDSSGSGTQARSATADVEGSSSKGGSEGQSAIDSAGKSVEELEQRPTSIGITTPMKKPLPTDKTIDYLHSGSATGQSLAETLVEVGGKVGWEVNAVEEGLTPEKLIAAWTKAIADEPDAIIYSGGFPREVFKNQLAEAAKKNIPVVSQSDTELPGSDVAVAVDGRPRYEKIGQRLGEIILAESNGKANILFAMTPYIPSDEFWMNITMEYLEDNCPDCTVEQFELSASTSDPAAATAAQVQSRPDIEYVILPFADFAQGLPSALASVSRNDVKVITQALSPTAAEYMKRGENVTAVYGYPGIEIEWRLVDALGRLFNGESTKVDEEVTYPEWLLTKETLPTDVKNPGYFPFVVDYEKQYRELWGTH